MPQEFDLRINNEEVIIESGTLRTYFDRPVSNFKASIPLSNDVNQAIIDSMKPYAAPTTQVLLEGELFLTGIIADPAPLKTPTALSCNAIGKSNTWKFHISHLEPPYELNGLTLEELARTAAQQTGTTIIFGESSLPVPSEQPLSRGSFPSGALAPSPIDNAKSILPRETIRQGQTGFTFCGPIAKKMQMVIGSTPQGHIVFHQPDLKSPIIGTIEEGRDFHLTEYQANFDITKRARTVKAITDSKFGPESATTAPSPITQPIHKIITITDQIPGGLRANADWELNLLAIKALTKEFHLIGWRLNDNLIKTNSRITVVSPTMGIPDGFTFFINACEHSKRAASKSVKISVVPPEAYTNQIVVEPYF